MIRENLERVEAVIAGACERAGRKREAVTLIAVSKTKPVELLQEAYDAGIRDFGENKVQEILDKYDRLPPDVRWHMIGHLQRNKVKYIIDKVCMIHSVDSLRLAQEISKEAVKKQVTVPVLIEVNIAAEETKFGVATAEELYSFVKEAAKLPNIVIKGLMCVAPATENPEDNREFFIALRNLSVDIKEKNIDNVSMDFLSMGMTGDYQIAVEEGAGFVRVGTGIFGRRDYAVP